jgi:hypothetical protein
MVRKVSEGVDKRKKVSGFKSIIYLKRCVRLPGGDGEVGVRGRLSLCLGGR